MHCLYYLFLKITISIFLALVLFSLTLASSAVSVGAMFPSCRSGGIPSLNEQFYDVSEFKNTVSVKNMFLESHMDSTIVVKGSYIESRAISEFTKIRYTYYRNLGVYSKFCVNRGIEINKDLFSNFESFYTIHTVMLVYMKNKIEKNDILNFLCIAQIIGTKIPDEMKFNSVNMYCNGEIAIFSLKKDGRQVFGFPIKIDGMFDK